MTLIVRSKRRILIVKALVIIAVASLIGWAVETWGFLSMNRLSGDLGLPVALAFFTFIGLVVAATTLKDQWGHRIEFEEERLRVDDTLGTAYVLYSDVEAVNAAGSYGVGIRLKPETDWLATFGGSEAAKQKMVSLSANAQRVYACDIAFPSETVDIGVDRFVEELRNRLPGETRRQQA